MKWLTLLSLLFSSSARTYSLLFCTLLIRDEASLSLSLSLSLHQISQSQRIVELLTIQFVCLKFFNCRRAHLRCTRRWLKCHISHSRGYCLARSVLSFLLFLPSLTQIKVNHFNYRALKCIPSVCNLYKAGNFCATLNHLSPLYSLSLIRLFLERALFVFSFLSASSFFSLSSLCLLSSPRYCLSLFVRPLHATAKIRCITYSSLSLPLSPFASFSLILHSRLSSRSIHSAIRLLPQTAQDWIKDLPSCHWHIHIEIAFCHRILVQLFSPHFCPILPLSLSSPLHLHCTFSSPVRYASDESIESSAMYWLCLSLSSCLSRWSLVLKSCGQLRQQINESNCQSYWLASWRRRVICSRCPLSIHSMSAHTECASIQFKSNDCHSCLRVTLVTLPSFYYQFNFFLPLRFHSAHQRCLIWTCGQFNYTIQVQLIDLEEGGDARGRRENKKHIQKAKYNARETQGERERCDVMKPQLLFLFHSVTCFTAWFILSQEPMTLNGTLIWPVNRLCNKVKSQLYDAKIKNKSSRREIERRDKETTTRRREQEWKKGVRQKETFTFFICLFTPKLPSWYESLWITKDASSALERRVEKWATFSEAERERRNTIVNVIASLIDGKKWMNSHLHEVICLYISPRGTHMDVMLLTLTHSPTHTHTERQIHSLTQELFFLCMIISLKLNGCKSHFVIAAVVLTSPRAIGELNVALHPLIHSSFLRVHCRFFYSLILIDGANPKRLRNHSSQCVQCATRLSLSDLNSAIVRSTMKLTDTRGRKIISRALRDKRRNLFAPPL